MRSYLSITLCCLMALSCTKQLDNIPLASQRMAQDYEVSLNDLQKGRDIFMQHCNACHERVPPGKIDPEAWRTILPHMSMRAHITKQDTQRLQNYLIAAHGIVHNFNFSHQSNP